MLTLIRNDVKPPLVNRATSAHSGESDVFRPSFLSLMERAVCSDPIKRTHAQRTERKISSRAVSFSFDTHPLSDMEPQALNLGFHATPVWQEVRTKLRESATSDSLVGRYIKLSVSQDQMAGMIEGALIFMYQLFQARSPMDRAVAFAAYARSQGHIIMDVGAFIVALDAAWAHLSPCNELSDMETQAFEFPTMPDFRTFLDHFDAFRSSKIYEKLYKFTMYALSFSLFQPVGVDFDYLKFDKVAAEAIRSKHHFGVDFIYTMCDTILFICERGYQCFQSGSILPMFHSEMKYQDWYDRAQKLSRQSVFMSNPKVHGIDRFAFLSELKDVIELGQSMRRITPRKEDKQMITRVLSSLEMTHDMELTKRAAQADRIAPFCVLLFGGSSIGKTTLTNILFQHYGKVRKLNTAPEFKYTRNPTEEFWSNFNSTQWCVQLDDIGFMAPTLNTMDPSLAEMLCVANNVPFVPAQAELQDKGRTPVQAELVIGSTNTESLNLPAYFSCPLAVQRRFPWVVDARPKPEYVDPDRPGMLDSARVPVTEDGTYPDYWNFDIKRVVPVGENRHRQMGRHEVVAQLTNMKDFIKWYTKALLDHHETQGKVMQCGDALRNTVLCGACSMPSQWCDCMQTQAGEEELPVDGDINNRDPTPSYLIDCDYDLFGEAQAQREAEDPLAHLKALPLKDRWVLAYYVWWYLFAFELGFISMLLAWWYGEWWYWRWVARSPFRPTLLRIGFGQAGRRAHAAFQPPKYLTQAAVAVVGLLAAYKVGSTVKSFLFCTPEEQRRKATARAASEYARAKEESHKKLDKLTNAARREWEDSSPETVDEMDERLVDFWLRERLGANYQASCAEYNAQVAQERLKTQANLIDPMTIGSEPVVEGDSREVYKSPYADAVPFSKSDLSPTSLCSKGSDPEVTMSKIESNTVVFDTLGDGIRRTTTAVIVRGGVYMCNNHGLPPTDTFHVHVLGESKGKLNAISRNILVTPSMIRRYPERDLAFVHLRCRPPGKDITAFFCKESYDGLLSGTYLGRFVTGTSWRTNVHALRKTTEAWRSHGNIVQRPMWRGVADTPTAVGDCGMVLFANTPAGHVILGIHTLGRGTDCGAMLVPRDLIIEASNYFEPNSMEAGVPTISAPSAQRWISNLSPQSIIHIAEPGTANVVGSYEKAYRPRQMSNVAPTLICKSMVERGYVEDRTKPQLHKRTPWVRALNDMTRPVTLMNNDILAAAKKDFLKGSRGIAAKGVMVYTVKAAVNGIAGLKYCDALNRKSSAGNPYKISKSSFLHPIEGKLGEDLVMPNTEIMDTIADIIACYHKGARWHPVFCGHLKDEPVTFEKAAEGKIRVFTASPFAWTVVARMYLLSVIVHMQTYRFVYETGPGTVAQSLEWEEVREYITQHGEDRIVAGDYSKFDKRMPANVILAAFDIILDICRRANYTEGDLQVVRGLAYDTAFPNVDFNGDLIEFYGSNPSGHPLTVIINGLANSLYMRYCYTVLAPLGTKAAFREHVALMTYGDDNIMGVSPDAPWFNHTAIVKVLGDIDIGYTMADKEAESVPYIHISDTNFLKRTWRWDEEVGAYLAPLDRTSINKMLTICTLKGNIEPCAHAIAVIETAVREYFWYGRQEFEQRVLMLKEVVEENNLSHLVAKSTFPTWQSLKDDFWSASEHVKLKRLA